MTIVSLATVPRIIGSTSNGMGGRADRLGASVGSAFSIFEHAPIANTHKAVRKSGIKIRRMILLEAIEIKTGKRFKNKNT
ncbi:hypothetical protein LBMAG51_00520 [Phycisphaerae bacterium]|nr:hypothetical protein LBMAG51_00520 [Phycisphaerae bacterium]